jgi:hypothetical protein
MSCSLIAATAFGCSGKKAPAAPTNPSPTTGVLKALQNGDRACYVVVTTDAGDLSSEGDFELCAGGSHDATALIGQHVSWTTQPSTVQAASCQGDPACSDSDEVDLVVTITATR